MVLLVLVALALVVAEVVQSFASVPVQAVVAAVVVVVIVARVASFAYLHEESDLANKPEVPLSVTTQALAPAFALALTSYQVQQSCDPREHGEVPYHHHSNLVRVMQML